MVLNDTIKHCFYCEREFVKENYGTNKPLARTRDHIIPASKGGSNHRTNMVYSCVQCNHFKADLLLELFIIKVENYIEHRSPYKQIPRKLFPLIVSNIKRLQDYIAEHNKSPHSHITFRKERRSLVGGYLERQAAAVKSIINLSTPSKDYDIYLQNQTLEQFKLAQKHGYVIAKLLTEPEPNFHEV